MTKVFVIFSLFFNFFVWLPFYIYLYLPWLKEKYVYGSMPFATYSLLNFLVALVPLFYVIFLLSIEVFFDNKKAIVLKKDT